MLRYVSHCDFERKSSPISRIILIFKFNVKLKQVIIYSNTTGETSTEKPAQIVGRLMAKSLKHGYLAARKTATSASIAHHHGRQAEFYREIGLYVAASSFTSEDLHEAVDKCQYLFRKRFDDKAAEDTFHEAKVLWFKLLSRCHASVCQVLHTIYPIRHEHNKDKFRNWELPLLKATIAVIGTSNIFRISKSLVPHIELHSYPGAKLQHIAHILKKYQGFQPTTVVISCGINDRSYSLRRVVESFNMIFKAARNAFPRSQVYFPQVNFNSKLPVPEKETLKSLNFFLANIEHAQIIPALPNGEFITESDLIHWNSTTANSVLAHWLTFIGV